MNIKYQIPAILWVLLITWLSVMPGANLPDINIFAPDKLGHAFVYAVLVFLILWAYAKNHHILPTRRYAIASVLATSCYGILLEYVQFSISTDRYFENLDILANIIGAILGALFFYFFIKKVALGIAVQNGIK